MKLSNFTKEERKEIITKLNLQGSTYEDIGRKFGVSRQYIQQLALAYGITWIKHYSRDIPATANCKSCGKEMTFPTYRRKVFCDAKCHKRFYPKKTLKEIRAYWNKRTRLYYHTVLKHKPEFREQIRINNQRYQKLRAARIASDPLFSKKYKAKVRAYQKKRYYQLKELSESRNRTTSLRA